MTIFNYTGANQSYVVPAGQYYIQATTIGSQGTDLDGIGGGGGMWVNSVHKVTPGETLTVVVGGTAAYGATSAFGGGGAGTAGGAPGGGATDIRQGGTALANRIVVAGGGGGAGGTESGSATYSGGNGGFPGATGGAGGGSSTTGKGGGGGSQTAGGAGGGAAASGTSRVAGVAGALGVGGRPVEATSGLDGSGGGGGGYYGGGSGSAYWNGSVTGVVGAGGGGSSRIISGLDLGTDGSGGGPGSAEIIPYVTPAPTFDYMVSPTTAKRFAIRVDIKQKHPSATGTRTITYEVSRYSDFVVPGGGTPNITKTVNFVENGTDGAITGDTTTTFAANTGWQHYMALWIELTLQGTWYIRVKTGGTENHPDSVWTTSSFTSIHVPAASIVYPTGSAYVTYGATTPFRITASDPYTRDTITAYQIIVERNDDGTVILDTGKAPLASPFTVGATQQVLNAAVPSSAKDLLLRWKVRVWDSTDVASAYTNYSLFTLVDVPAVAITYPAEGGTTDTGAPTFSWSVGLTAGRTIASTQITVRQASNNAVIWQKTITGNLTTTTPETTVLVNGVGYSVTVIVTDSVGLVGSDANLFSTVYVSPDPIVYTVDASLLLTDGYVEINWGNQPPDSRLIAWRVYRRELPSNTWELVKEIPDEGTKVYRDYLFHSGRSYMWTVTQLADRSGAILESPIGTRANSTTAGDIAAEAQIESLLVDRYWLIYEDHPELTVMLAGVTSAGESLSREETIFQIVGRGRHKDIGDDLGYEGSFTIQIRQPERQSLLRLQIEELWRTADSYWLRTPFGKLLRVSLGNLDWSPMAGTGPTEMGDLTVPWVEVA